MLHELAKGSEAVFTKFLDELLIERAEQPEADDAQTTPSPQPHRFCAPLLYT